MPRRASKSSSFITLLILLAALGLWISDAADWPENTSEPRSAARPTADSSKTSRSGDSGNYQTYHHCSLVTHRSNDGDSFKVRFPDGRTEILRLYFVDAPESDFKSYSGGRNNHKRIAEQASYFDRITSEQAVEIGRQAKRFTLSLLAEKAFTVHTAWDSPFKDQRYHAFIELGTGRSPRFLHQLLVEKGLARIHTKGADLPDGTPGQNWKKQLFELQRGARSEPAGAWKL